MGGFTVLLGLERSSVTDYRRGSNFRFAPSATFLAMWPDNVGNITLGQACCQQAIPPKFHLVLRPVVSLTASLASPSLPLGVING